MALFDLRSTLRPLRHRPFAFYCFGNGVSLIGTWMQRVATGWLAWQLTESGAWLGLIATAEFLPALFVAPLAGAAADRWDKVMLIKVGQIVAMILTLILVGLTATGLITIWLLFILAGLIGIAVSFVQPARYALVPLLVPRDDVGPAVALNSVVFNTARFIGPMIAGVIISTSGVSGAFFANAVSYLIFFAALTRIHLPPAPETAGAGKPAFLRQLVDGLSYTARHTGIASVLLLLVAMSLTIRPLTDLLPGFIGAVFHAGPLELAILTSVTGIGSIAGALWLGGLSGGRGYFTAAVAAALVGAVAVMAFAATDQLWIGAVLMVVYGAAATTTGVATQTSIQLAVEPSLAGRVLSLYGLIFRGTPAIGALVMGVASERFGFQPPLFVAAALFALATVILFTRRAAIVASLEPPDPSTAATAEPIGSDRPPRQ